LSDHILSAGDLTAHQLKARSQAKAPRARPKSGARTAPLLAKTCWDNFPGLITAETAEAEPLEGRLFPEREEPDEPQSG
jgi:hypothetical protein